MIKLVVLKKVLPAILAVLVVSSIGIFSCFASDFENFNCDQNNQVDQYPSSSMSRKKFLNYLDSVMLERPCVNIKQQHDSGRPENAIYSLDLSDGQNSDDMSVE